ncbi:hypothetical protein [Caudoviricetes sp.]|nr:hypothetical protein [Caudoviricetes sp.]
MIRRPNRSTAVRPGKQAAGAASDHKKRRPPVCGR